MSGNTVCLRPGPTRRVCWDDKTTSKAKRANQTGGIKNKDVNHVLDHKDGGDARNR